VLVMERPSAPTLTAHCTPKETCACSATSAAGSAPSTSWASWPSQPAYRSARSCQPARARSSSCAHLTEPSHRAGVRRWGCLAGRPRSLGHEESAVDGSRVAPLPQILAPTLVRSQILSLLYQAVHRGELTKKNADQQLNYLRGLRIRLLGDSSARGSSTGSARRSRLPRFRRWRSADALERVAALDVGKTTLTSV